MSCFGAVEDARLGRKELAVSDLGLWLGWFRDVLGRFPLTFCFQAFVSPILR